MFFCFVAVNFARFETAGSFDYGFAHENARELFTPLGRTIVLANVQAWEVACLFVLPLVLGLALVRLAGAALAPTRARARARASRSRASRFSWASRSRA